MREEDLEHVLEEVNIYLEMDHPNIARLFRVYCQKNALILVMEHCSGGSLAERLLRRSRFFEDEARLAVVQILRAVHYCHHHPHVSVCHRDLKPLNCVYENPSDDAALKLVDFGLAQLVRQHSMLMSGKAGTLHFMAPEVVWNKRPYNNKCDLWSVGVIAYSLLCGYPPFHGDTDREVRRAILSHHPRPMSGQSWRGVSVLAMNFVSSLLAKDPAKRPSTDAALDHVWFAPLANSLRMPSSLSSAVLTDVTDFAGCTAVQRAVATLAIYLGFVPNSVHRELLEGEFRRLDASGRGMVSAQTFARALHESLGISEERAKEIFARIDANGQSDLTVSEFFAAAYGARLLRNHDVIQEAFERFDEDGDGVIGVEEFVHVLGDEFCGESTRAIFRECDVDGNHFIDAREFEGALAQNSRNSVLFDIPRLRTARDVEAQIRFNPKGTMFGKRRWSTEF